MQLTTGKFTKVSFLGISELLDFKLGFPGLQVLIIRAWALKRVSQKDLDKVTLFVFEVPKGPVVQRTSETFND